LRACRVAATQMFSSSKSPLDQVRELKKLLEEADETLSQVRRAVISLEMRLSEDTDREDRGDRPSLWTRGRR
jgi:hypothetical protein